MSTDRSARTIVAAVFFVVALFVAMNYAVSTTPFLDWWLPLILFVIGLALVLPGVRSGTPAAVEEEPEHYIIREYRFGAPITPPLIVPGGDEAVIAAPETLTPAGETVSPAETVIPAPETQTPEGESDEPERGNGFAPAEKPPARVIQPADTKENEFQTGEHVAAKQPTLTPPTPTQTTGEAIHEGVEPIAPEKQKVLDTTAAPPPTDPEVAERVMSDTQSDADVETLVKTEPMPLTSAVSESGDLTIIEGIGGKMAAALKAAGIDTVGKLAQASDETLRAAIEAAGIRLAPSLPAWRDQALLLIKGDQAGFEALKKKLASARRGQQ